MTKDYVRLEIATALARKVRVVPVLVDDGTAIWDTAAIFEHLYERHPGRMAKGPFRTRACAQHQRRDPLCV